MTAAWQDRYVSHAWAERGGAILLLNRCAGRHLGDRWDIPGGTVESGGTPLRAAVRETYEDADIPVTAEGELTRYSNPDSRSRTLLFRTVPFHLTEPSGPVPVVLNPVEHGRFPRLPQERALGMGLVGHVRAVQTP